jgi:hypothetical protein
MKSKASRTLVAQVDELDGLALFEERGEGRLLVIIRRMDVGDRDRCSQGMDIFKL